MERIVEAIAATPLIVETVLVVGFLTLLVMIRRTVIGNQNRRSS